MSTFDAAEIYCLFRMKLYTFPSLVETLQGPDPQAIEIIGRANATGYLSGWRDGTRADFCHTITAVSLQGPYLAME